MMDRRSLADLDATQSVDTWRANAPSGALADHPRLPVVRLGPPVRDAHDQGRSPLQGDVVDLVLLPRDDPADVQDRRLRDLADRSRHDAQRRRPSLVQRREVLASVKLSWWLDVVLRHLPTVTRRCIARAPPASVSLDQPSGAGEQREGGGVQTVANLARRHAGARPRVGAFENDAELEAGQHLVPGDGRKVAVRTGGVALATISSRVGSPPSCRRAWAELRSSLPRHRRAVPRPISGASRGRAAGRRSCTSPSRRSRRAARIVVRTSRFRGGSRRA